jgi:hypothetical protein
MARRLVIQDFIRFFVVVSLFLEFKSGVSHFDHAVSKTLLLTGISLSQWSKFTAHTGLNVMSDILPLQRRNRGRIHQRVFEKTRKLLGEGIYFEQFICHPSTYFFVPHSHADLCGARTLSNKSW